MPPQNAIVVSGAREHNLKDVSLTLPRDSLVVITGLSGLGQVVARVRHDLRRGPAPLRRVAERLRAPVPRPDGQARRRLDRGSVAGDLDRPEDDVAQPALDGRHGHRDLRLPAPAVVAHRPSALPHLRQARSPGQSAEQIIDQVMELPEGTRFMVLAPIVRGRKGEYGKALRGAARRGLRSASQVDGELRIARGADRARQEVQARHLGRRRPPRDAPRPAQAPGRLDRDGGGAGRRHRSRSRPCRARATASAVADVLRELRLPRMRHVDARARAADLLVQLAARRLRALHRPGLADGDRSRPDRPRPVAVDRRGRAGAVGDVARRSYYEQITEAIAEQVPHRPRACRGRS